MVYFTSTISREEILQLIANVNTNVFCLWQGEKGKILYGVIKDSAYELFVKNCSVSVLRHMEYLTLKQIVQTARLDDSQVICGNRNLMD